MANASIITNLGKNTMIYRAYTANVNLSTTQYLAATKVQLGISNGTPAIGDTILDSPIPYANGVVNDNGDNLLTGSNGGDNTTDNLTTYKEGAGATDVTSQNLIANNGNATKTWTIADLSALGIVVDGAKYCSMWLYIKDATALAKFLTAGTAFQIKLRTNGDGATLFYTVTKTAAQLAVGWNFITNENTIVTSWTAGGGGAPSGVIDELILEITTNNATDTFTTGDVIYDLLRSWAIADTKNAFQASYPTFDYVNNEVTIRSYFNSLQANGFLISGVGVYNEDTSPLLLGEDTLTGQSKSLTDEFAFVIKDRLI